MTTRMFTAIFRQEGDWWAAWVVELPGAHSQGRTLEEARENLREAVQLVLEVSNECAARETAAVPVVREELVVPVAA